MIDFEVKKGFGSDNHSGIHPELLAAINNANRGHLSSYGNDPLCEDAYQTFSLLFGKKVACFFVFNGTAANTLSLKAMTSGFNSVICSDTSHIHHDECAAPEAWAHCKLIPLPSQHGKISLPDIEAALVRMGDQHCAQPRVVSLTQPTELGTCYSIKEIREIVSFAHSRKLLVHVDGARIANAVTFLNTSLQEMITETGVDVLSFGGTKNGFLFGEAVVFLNTELSKNFQYIRKQGLNLPSKSRFIAAQFLRYFEDDLWANISQHSLKMAQLLSEEITKVPGLQITHPVQSNTVFTILPRQWIKWLREKYFFYVWDEKTFEIRLVTSFDTTSEDVLKFAELLREASVKFSQKA